jgi:hypothetical protein
MWGLLKQVALAMFLVVVAAASFIALFTGLLSGDINGPVKGRDHIELATSPILFWVMAVFHLVVGVAATYFSYRLLIGPKKE